MDDKRMEVAGVKEKFTIVIGCGVARNYSLAYTRQAADGGRADMVESHDSVEGKVYRIDQDALHYLFQREGVNAHIYRPAFIDVKIDGLSYKNVVTFLVIDKEEEVAPPAHYAMEILRGAQDFVSVDYYRNLKNGLMTKFQMKLEGGHF
ncbi:cation transport regulator ChaC [Evansella vedderi]|uniref:Cation transport regulator ChaC n=1 Tax=Evansella vedderi TaxID=38282 RepID=A0ABT9ZR48_9BACI|nr:cation transport regulator ChaC [Evansella vedderi]